MKRLLLTLFISIFLLLSLSFTTKSEAGEIEAGIRVSPGDTPPQICILNRNVRTWDEFPPGFNPLDYRSASYAFTGEQIEYTIIVRDPDTAPDIGNVYIMVDQNPKLLCKQIPPPMECFPGPDGTPICLPSPCDNLGIYNHETDKAFLCRYTVEPINSSSHQLAIGVENMQGVQTGTTYTENWFFNPKMTVSITTSDGEPIRFESGHPGESVHSINKIIVKNMGDGGMNIWVFIASTDFTDSRGTSRCPFTNKLDVEGLGDDTGLWYKGIKGAFVGDWAHITNPEQNEGCAINECHNAQPVPFLQPFNPNNHILSGEEQIEIHFRLKYPLPCIGTFNEGIIYIFVKAV